MEKNEEKKEYNFLFSHFDKQTQRKRKRKLRLHSAQYQTYQSIKHQAVVAERQHQCRQQQQHYSM